MSKRRARLGREPSLVDVYFGESGDSRDRKTQRKDAQLCAQIAEALSFALAGSDDPLLSDLWVVAVEPAPHMGHLRVSTQSGSDGDLDAIQARLESRQGYLRRQVAEAIVRKKVPSLAFVVLPAQRDEEDADE